MSGEPFVVIPSFGFTSQNHRLNLRTSRRNFLFAGETVQAYVVIPPSAVQAYSRLHDPVERLLVAEDAVERSRAFAGAAASDTSATKSPAYNQLGRPYVAQPSTVGVHVRMRGPQGEVVDLTRQLGGESCFVGASTAALASGSHFISDQQAATSTNTAATAATHTNISDFHISNSSLSSRLHSSNFTPCMFLDHDFASIPLPSPSASPLASQSPSTPATSSFSACPPSLVLALEFAFQPPQSLMPHSSTSSSSSSSTSSSYPSLSSPSHLLRDPLSRFPVLGMEILLSFPSPTYLPALVAKSLSPTAVDEPSEVANTATLPHPTASSSSSSSPLTQTGALSAASFSSPSSSFSPSSVLSSSSASSASRAAALRTFVRVVRTRPSATTLCTAPPLPRHPPGPGPGAAGAAAGAQGLRRTPSSSSGYPAQHITTPSYQPSMPYLSSPTSISLLQPTTSSSSSSSSSSSTSTSSLSLLAATRAMGATRKTWTGHVSAHATVQVFNPVHVDWSVLAPSSSKRVLAVTVTNIHLSLTITINDAMFSCAPAPAAAPAAATVSSASTSNSNHIPSLSDLQNRHSHVVIRPTLFDHVPTRPDSRAVNNEPRHGPSALVAPTSSSSFLSASSAASAASSSSSSTDRMGSAEVEEDDTDDVIPLVNAVHVTATSGEASHTHPSSISFSSTTPSIPIVPSASSSGPAKDGRVVSGRSPGVDVVSSVPREGEERSSSGSRQNNGTNNDAAADVDVPAATAPATSTSTSTSFPIKQKHGPITDGKELGFAMHPLQPFESLSLVFTLPTSSALSTSSQLHPHLQHQHQHQHHRDADRDIVQGGIVIAYSTVFFAQQTPFSRSSPSSSFPSSAMSRPLSRGDDVAYVCEPVQWRAPSPPLLSLTITPLLPKVSHARIPCIRVHQVFTVQVTVTNNSRRSLYLSLEIVSTSHPIRFVHDTSEDLNSSSASSSTSTFPVTPPQDPRGFTGLSQAPHRHGRSPPLLTAVEASLSAFPSSGQATITSSSSSSSSSSTSSSSISPPVVLHPAPRLSTSIPASSTGRNGALGVSMPVSPFRPNAYASDRPVSSALSPLVSASAAPAPAPSLLESLLGVGYSAGAASSSWLAGWTGIYGDAVNTTPATSSHTLSSAATGNASSSSSSSSSSNRKSRRSLPQSKTGTRVPNSPVLTGFQSPPSSHGHYHYQHHQHQHQHPPLSLGESSLSAAAAAAALALPSPPSAAGSGDASASLYIPSETDPAGLGASVEDGVLIGGGLRRPLPSTVMMSNGRGNDNNNARSNVQKASAADDSDGEDGYEDEDTSGDDDADYGDGNSPRDLSSRSQRRRRRQELARVKELAQFMDLFGVRDDDEPVDMDAEGGEGVRKAEGINDLVVAEGEEAVDIVATSKSMALSHIGQVGHLGHGSQDGSSGLASLVKGSSHLAPGYHEAQSQAQAQAQVQSFTGTRSRRVGSNCSSLLSTSSGLRAAAAETAATVSATEAIIALDAVVPFGRLEGGQDHSVTVRLMALRGGRINLDNIFVRDQETGAVLRPVDPICIHVVAAAEEETEDA